MLPLDWQLTSPLDAIIFDCDGTLSNIEGIDKLAKLNNVGVKVKNLTESAMAETGINADLYNKRLQLTKPRENQVNEIADEYIKHVTKDTFEVIAIHQRLHKEIFIISAGLLPTITPFAAHLNIPEKNVFAVGIRFNHKGEYLDFERDNNLIKNSGKRSIVNTIMQRFPRIAYIGDGLNDLPVKALVTRFVGFGGAFYRKNIADMCDYYITENSMAPFLPLTLTTDEYNFLSENEKMLYERGLEDLNNQKIK